MLPFLTLPKLTHKEKCTFSFDHQLHHKKELLGSFMIVEVELVEVQLLSLVDKKRNQSFELFKFCLGLRAGPQDWQLAHS